MKRSESSSAVNRYNQRRKSSFAGGRTASASMIGLLTLKNSTSISDLSKKETSGWSKLFSPLSFKFDNKKKENDQGYSLSRRRTNEYSKSCPNFQRKGSLRPSLNIQVREESRKASLSSTAVCEHLSELDLFGETKKGDILSLTKNTYNSEDLIGIDDLSSSVFEPIIASSIFNRNSGFSRVQAFSRKESGLVNNNSNYSNRYGKIASNRDINCGSASERNTLGRGNESKDMHAGDVQILRFHDGIAGKTYKSRTLNDKGETGVMECDKNYVEIDSNTKTLMFNKDEYSINKNICVDNSLKSKSFVQGDIPYCDAILYLDNPKPPKNSTYFSKLHDSSTHFYSDEHKSSFISNDNINQMDDSCDEFKVSSYTNP